MALINIDEKELSVLVKEEAEKIIKRKINQILNSGFGKKNYIEDIIKDCVWDYVQENLLKREEIVKEELNKAIECIVPDKTRIVNLLSSTISEKVLDELYDR